MNLKNSGSKFGLIGLIGLFFLILSFAFFYPLLEGKVINQSDVTQARGQQRELAEVNKETGRTPLWTNSMFSGMPTYLISMGEHGNVNIFHQLGEYIRLGLPRHSVDLFFLYLIGFFLLCYALDMNVWLSTIGAIAFALSSYNIIYIEAGHVNKAAAIAMIPYILAGIFLSFKKKWYYGALLFCFALGIQLAYNHFQITYYTLLMVLVWGGYKLYYSYTEKQIALFGSKVAILAVIVILAIVPNLISILPTNEYLKVSSRSGSELAASGEKTKKTGLDKDYAFAWSYAPWETFTVLIPNFKGGSTVGSLNEDSHLYTALRKNGVPNDQAKQYISQVYTYWGAKNSTAGPFYFGAIIVFLFILGLFIVPGQQKWWLLTISILAILWSWGENFYWFSSLFFDYLPYFNKFRVPETFLVITSVTFPALALLSIKELLSGKINKDDLKKYLIRSFYIVGGLLLFFILFAKGLFSFESKFDAYYSSQMQAPNWFIDAVRNDRALLLRKDALRSLVFIVLGAGSILLYLNKRLKINRLYLVLGVLIFVDLWSVDKRYLSSENFVMPKAFKEIQPTAANLQIMKDTDPHFRVFTLNNPFNSSFISNFHNSIGGYHAAKIARYDDIIQQQLSKNNIQVLNMLNAKYIIAPAKDGNEIPQRNPDALGNVWTVNTIQWVSGAQEEMNALNDFNPAQTVVVDKKYETYFQTYPLPDSVTFQALTLTGYQPEKLNYRSESSTGGFAIFSEIYYNDKRGWNAYINGEKVEHIRVNYLLRGMYLPAGKHDIEFRFEPQTVYKAKRISTYGSLLVLAMFLGVIIVGIKDFLKPSMTE